METGFRAHPYGQLAEEIPRHGLDGGELARLGAALGRLIIITIGFLRSDGGERRGNAIVEVVEVVLVDGRLYARRRCTVD